MLLQVLPKRRSSIALLSKVALEDEIQQIADAIPVALVLRAVQPIPIGTMLKTSLTL
jgi:hypothetical protein